MQEYKTNYYQMNAIVDMLEQGWTITDVEACQGYMRISLTRGDEEWQFDMEAILSN